MVTYVKIVAGSHLAASLQETLAASWKDGTYADLTVQTFPSSDQIEQNRPAFRTNTSVVAAASPVLRNILREAGHSDVGGPTLVFAGYHPTAISSFFRFIYQGHTVLGNEIDEFRELLREFGVDTESEVSLVSTGLSIVRKQKTPVVRDVVARGVSLYSDKNLHLDPLAQSSKYESMYNPDSRRQSSILEKSALKYRLLPPYVVDPDRPSQFDWLVRRASPDHVGIYWDSSLHVYYENLVRSLPPFRIFLRIDMEPRREEVEKATFHAEPAFTYGKRLKGHFVTRKTVGNTRLPALSICRVSGKCHVVLSGTLRVDTSPQDVPSFDEQPDDLDTTQQGEEQVSEVFGEELRRKRVLHSTLSRLKREYLNARRVALEILRSCRDLPDRANREIEARGSDGTTSSPRPTPRKRLKTVCEICGKAVTSSWLQAHMANHRGSKPYLCEHCGRCFATNNLLRSHCYYQHNSSVSRFVCGVCSKAFPKKSRLETHMRIHNEERPFPCTVCEKRFHTNSNLQKHLLVHLAEKPFQCHECGKSFSHKSSLNVHTKRHTVSGDEVSKKTYHCNVCSLIFSRPKRYHAHVRSHGGFDGRLSCTLCLTDFKSADELTRHKTEAHPGKFHPCVLCGKVFPTRTALQKHSALHNMGGEVKKSFSCTFCKAQFTCAATCRDHERRHTGEKPFQCGKCGKSFASRHNYSQHLRVHSDERPHACQFCGSSFKQHQHLKTHLTVHDPSNIPVNCVDCGKQYRNKLLLMSHQKVHKQKVVMNNS